MNVAGRVLGCTLVVAGLLTSGCTARPAEQCDPRIVKAFDDLPRADGADVDLHGSPGIGCTDTVSPSDPQAFIDHYERAMREAGWTVLVDGTGAFGRGPSAALRFDRLEGNDVGVYALSLEDITSSSE